MTVERKPETGQTEEDAPRTQENTMLSLLLPVARVWTRGEDWSFRITTGILADTGFDSGPAGRFLSHNADIRADLVPNLSTESSPGGLALLPLLFTGSRVDHRDQPDLEDSEIDRDIALWPFFVWGSGSPRSNRREPEFEDDHFSLAIAPFGGTTREILGKEEITWYGFPYPIYARARDRAWTSHHVLWPLIHWVEEDERRSGFRFLPFYGHFETKNRFGQLTFEHTFVMWPFFNYVGADLEKDEPTEALLAWPFYGYIEGGKESEWTVLWPFIRYTRNKREGGWELRAPFPILTVGAGGDLDRFRFDLWPLFGVNVRSRVSSDDERRYVRNGDYLRTFFLWPLFRTEDLDYPESGYSFSGRWFLPFFWRTEWEDEQEGWSESRTHVFPFARHRSLRDGTTEFALLSPWLYEDAFGFERTVEPFFRLYRYLEEPDGSEQHQLLMGLASWRDRPARPDRRAYSRLSLLFGLIHYRELGDESGLRLLYLPEITWGGDPGPVGEGPVVGWARDGGRR